MKRVIIALLSCALITNAYELRARSTTCSHADCGSSCSESDDCINECFKNLRTSVHFRSQGANTARELVGWQWELNKPEMCENYIASYLAFEFQRSFREEELADALFGNCSLSFAGSDVPDRRPQELVADNFGLARDFRGTITFNPRFENYILDLGLFFGLDYWVQGLYLRFHTAFVHARTTIDRNCGNCVSIETGTRDEDGALKQFEACYMNQNPVDTAETISSALSGRFLFGDMQTPWVGGRFEFSRQTRNGLADIDVIVGYNICNDDCYHIGFYGMAVLPTGKKRKNLFIFDPTVGNGKHFELGGGISAHTVLWSGEDSNLALFLEGNVTHMFKSRQNRTFDLKDNGPFSRYLLLKEYDTDGSIFTYNNNLFNANFFTTREVEVSLAAKGDASLKLAYRWCGLGIDVGYNIYGHSNEKIDLRCNACPTTIDRRKFAIKGTAPVCCSQFTIAVLDGVNVIVPAGTDFPAGAVAPDDCDALVNPSTVIQNPSNADQPDATAFNPGTLRTGEPGNCFVCVNSGTITEVTEVDALETPAFSIDTGLQPRLLSVNDLNIRSGEAHSVITHKLFSFLSYTWMDECGWNPHIGVGFELEFDGNHGRSSGEKTGQSQWGILIKGGLTF